MEPYQLVIAEDNPKDFEFLRQTVAEWPQECQVTHAVNGLEALEAASQLETPLVISDIQMPQMNGVDFARALWERKPFARIVFWSQFKDEMYIRTLARIVPPETVYGYILKSNSREKIATAISTVLFDEQCWVDPEVRKVQGRDKVGDAFNLRNRAVAVALHRGLINAFELENEEQELQAWLKRFKSGRG
jgi:DNA-binding NarL/FixJ family response regulator